MKLPPQHGVRSKAVYSSVGSSMLRKMGWSEGKGLGKNEDGHAECIKVKQKQDTQGVGSKADVWDWKNLWWEDAFNATLQKLNAGKEEAASDDSTDSRVSVEVSEDTDEDKEEKVQKKRKRSKQKERDVEKVLGRDGVLVTAREHEIRIAAELAKDPWGRWGGRNGKLARIAKQEEEFLQKNKANTTGRCQTVEVDSTTSKKHKKREDKPAKKEKKSSRKKALVEQTECTATCAKRIPSSVEVKRPVMPESWWGHQFGFVHGGGLETLEKKTQEENEAKCFTENDQTNIYKAAQSLKQQGKLGLGVKGSKINTNDWQGKKVLFGEDAQDSESNEGKIKWKKLVKRCLEKEPNREMRLRKLVKAVLHSATESMKGQTGTVDLVGAERDLQNWLSTSDKVTVLGKRIRYMSG